VVAVSGFVRALLVLVLVAWEVDPWDTAVVLLLVSCSGGRGLGGGLGGLSGGCGDLGCRLGGLSGCLGDWSCGHGGATVLVLVSARLDFGERQSVVEDKVLVETSVESSLVLAGLDGTAVLLACGFLRLSASLSVLVSDDISAGVYRESDVDPNPVEKVASKDRVSFPTK